MSRRQPKLLLPAIKCRMGDRTYIVAAFPLKEVAARIKRTDEVHESKQLAEWIQRELDGKHAKLIAEYLNSDETRMFSALVLGIYGGSPEWGELSLVDPRDELNDADQDRMTRSVGVLTLSGSEKLFAIDGQHRVAGIKKALESNPGIGDEEVAVIIIGHDNKSHEGRVRTRRLFIKLNQTAKRVSDRDFVALSEDNGLAVVTRMIVDEAGIFKSEDPEDKRLLSFSGRVELLESNENAVTSVLALYQIVRALYPRKHATWPNFTRVQRARPDALKEIYEYNLDYWNVLIETVPEYKGVFGSGRRKSSGFRTAGKNHFLFRPVGQFAFARATELVIRRKGLSLADAVGRLYSGISPWLDDAKWRNILWDGKRILTKPSLAETLILTEANFAPRSPAALKKLKEAQKTPSSE